MDAVNYVLFKNPVVTYSVAAIKYATNGVSNVVFTNNSPSSPIKAPPMTKHELLQLLRWNPNYFRIAGLFGASAVIMGAYGAHTLLAKEGHEHEKKVFETASQYHFYHTLAFLAVPFSRFPKLTAVTMAGGIIIFCGSCYYQSLTGDSSPKKITPYGGSLLILGWLTLVL